MAARRRLVVSTSAMAVSRIGYRSQPPAAGLSRFPSGGALLAGVQLVANMVGELDRNLRGAHWGQIEIDREGRQFREAAARAEDLQMPRDGRGKKRRHGEIGLQRCEDRLEI